MNGRKTLVLVGILLAIVNNSASHSAECEFKYRSNGHEVPRTYECILSHNIVFKSSKNAVITSITGEHEDSKTNADVVGFISNSRKLQYFPKGLIKFFPNLITLRLDNCKISSLTQEDLKSYRKLQHLSMRENLLTTIEKDLFMFNTEIVSISFTLNQITYIHPNVFDDLSKLNTLHLNDLSCISKNALNNRAEVQELIKSVKSKCNDPQYPALKLQIMNLESQEDSIDLTEFKQRLAKLEEDIAGSNYDNLQTFQKSLKNLQELQRLKEIEARVQNAVDSIKGQLHEIMGKLNTVSRQCSAPKIG